MTKTTNNCNRDINVYDASQRHIYDATKHLGWEFSRF